MPRGSVAITVDEADEYVDVVESSTPVHGGVESERFILGNSVSHAFLKDSSGVHDTSVLRFIFLKSHLHSAFVFLGRIYLLATM